MERQTGFCETIVQAEPLDEAGLIARLRAACPDAGALASFVGLVRGEGRIAALTLEIHPRMTAASVATIAADALARFAIAGIIVVHRHGRMTPGEPIVLVAAMAAHRAPALDAVGFAIDRLKTEALFWKREERLDGSQGWVAAREADARRSAAWESGA